MPPVRILVADDHAITSRGLRALLAHDAEFEICPACLLSNGGYQPCSGVWLRPYTRM